MSKKILALLVSILAFSSVALSCVTHEEIVTEKTKFETEELFLVVGEDRAVRQHLAYHKGRPYFNYSLCEKGTDRVGFRIEGAYKYENDQCYFLGQWMPVYNPLGQDVFPYFLKAFEENAEETFKHYEKVSRLKPYVNSIRALLQDYKSTFLALGGFVIIAQAYQLAPLANTFGSGKGKVGNKSNMRAMRFGGLLAFLGVLGLVDDAYDRAGRVDVQKEKMAEIILATRRLQKEMDAVMSEADDDQDFFVKTRIVDVLIESIAVALATLELKGGSMCSPMIPEHERQFYSET